MPLLVVSPSTWSARRWFLRWGSSANRWDGRPRFWCCRSSTGSIARITFISPSWRTEKKQVEIEKRNAEEVALLHLRTIESLALAIEAKDHTSHKHLQRVRVFAVEVAKELGFPEDEIEALRAAALLHDIGKLAVPDHIINKPGRLTPEEFEKMKIHTLVGAEILERVAFPYPVAPIVRSHHERWDGKGYPDGLKGEQIPMGARVLAAVDCLDALHLIASIATPCRLMPPWRRSPPCRVRPLSPGLSNS